MTRQLIDLRTAYETLQSGAPLLMRETSTFPPNAPRTYLLPLQLVQVLNHLHKKHCGISGRARSSP